MSAPRNLLFATTALCAVLGARLASAQDAPTITADAVELPEMDVRATAWRSWQPVQGYVAPTTTTGSKTDTPLIEAPQSLGIVTRQQMDDQAAQSVSRPCATPPASCRRCGPARATTASSSAASAGRGPAPPS